MLFPTIINVYWLSKFLKSFFAFTCKAKTFVIAILVFFHLFLLSIGRTGKTIWNNFCQLLLWTCMTKIRSPLLNFIFYALEISSNDAFKQEHAEFCCSSNNINSTTTIPVATKLDWVVTYHEGLPPKNHMTHWSCGLARSCDKLKSF